MLAICPDSNAGLANKLKGYTLLELLVVLSLMGLITAIALPNLVSLYSRFSNRLELEVIVNDINGIGYQAFQEQRQYWLRNREAHQSGEPTTSAEAGANNPFESNSGNFSDIKALSDHGTYPLTLPPGWILSVEQAVHYNFNGACSGGDLRLHYLGELILGETLKPPHCQIHEG